jgi:hypothetical protein
MPRRSKAQIAADNERKQLDALRDSIRTEYGGLYSGPNSSEVDRGNETPESALDTILETARDQLQEAATTVTLLSKLQKETIANLDSQGQRLTESVSALIKITNDQAAAS